MNKIIVDKEKVLKLNSDEILLEIRTKKVAINIQGQVVINDLSNNEELEMTINIDSNSSLVYNNFAKGKINNSVIINQNSNSILIYNYSILVQEKSFFKIDANIKSNNINCEINVKAVTKEQGSLEIIATGDIVPNIKKIKYLENLRILALNDEENIIIPNLFVSSNNLEALHNATISRPSKEEIFYLTSKGLSSKKAQDLIMRGYLINNLKLKEEQKELIISKI